MFKNVCERISFFLPFLVLIPVYVSIVGVNAIDAIRHNQTHTHAGGLIWTRNGPVEETSS